jgi:transcriptional regulator with XRE-family HTH domain
MTPFGKKMRELRAAKGIALKAMAHEIGVSPAYLSALEHGRRGQPTWYLVQRIISFFNVIWDEAEELERLAAISDPKVTLNTAGLSPDITEAANLFARSAASMSEADARDLLQILRRIEDSSTT